MSRPGVATTMSAWRTPGDLRADGHAPVDRGDAHADGPAQRRERRRRPAGRVPGSGRGPAREVSSPGAGPARPPAGSAAEGRRPASCPTRSGRGPARRGRPARRAAPGPGSRTARGCHPPRAPGPAGGPGRARRRWPRPAASAAAAASRARSSSACGAACGGRGVRGVRGPRAAAAATGRRARTPGSMRHAGNSITVRGPHARQTSTTTATGGRLARGAAAKIAALECKAISRAGIPRSRCGWPRARRSGASR